MIWNLFFGDYPYYYPEIIKRFLSYIVLFYLFFVGIILCRDRDLISDKFYYFLVFVGILQVYSIFKMPFYKYIVDVFDNHLIDSFATVSNRVLFFEAEPSYVAFLIIFLMVFYEQKNKFVLLIFSFLTISVRTTMVSFLYFIKNRPFVYGSLMLLIIPIILVKAQVSYSVFDRLKAVTTFQKLDPSIYVRVVNNKIGLQIIYDYPIFGVGPGQYSSYYSGKYLANFETRGINELQTVLDTKRKTADPYSLIIGIISELGLFSFLWILISFLFLLRNSHRKYLIGIISLILMWGYPFGKPYIWILLGFLFEEIRMKSRNNYSLTF